MIGTISTIISPSYQPPKINKNKELNQYINKKIRIKKIDCIYGNICSTYPSKSLDTEVTSVIIGKNYIAVYTYLELLDATNSPITIDSYFVISVSKKEYCCMLTGIYHDGNPNPDIYKYYFNIKNK